MSDCIKMTTLSMYMYVYSDKNKGSNRRNGCSERGREGERERGTNPKWCNCLSSLSLD